MSVAGVVLAAGEGRRFGATKQLALLEGVPLVVHVVRVAMAAALDHVVVVLGHDAARVRAALAAEEAGGAVVVRNERHAEGQSSSLRVGLGAAAALGADAAVVLLGDEPLVSSAPVDALVAAHEAGTPIARTRYDDRAGHPVLLGRELWPELAELEGDRGARDRLRAPDVVELRVDGPAPRDVDRPGDLAELAHPPHDADG